MDKLPCTIGEAIDKGLLVYAIRVDKSFVNKLMGASVSYVPQEFIKVHAGIIQKQGRRCKEVVGSMVDYYYKKDSLWDSSNDIFRLSIFKYEYDYPVTAFTAISGGKTYYYIFGTSIFPMIKELYHFLRRKCPSKVQQISKATFYRLRKEEKKYERIQADTVS